MDDGALVGVVQGGADLISDVDDLRQLEVLAETDDFLQSLALDVFLTSSRMLTAPTPSMLGGRDSRLRT